MGAMKQRCQRPCRAMKELAISLNTGALSSVGPKPELVPVNLPALPPLCDLEWLVKPVGADLVAGDVKAPARLLLAVPLRAPVEARETCALPEVPPLRPLGAAGFKPAGAGDRPGGRVPDAKPLAEALPTAGAGAEPSTHTPSGCLAYGKLPFPAVQLELPLDEPPPPAGVEPVVALVFALFAPNGPEAEAFCAGAACRLRAKATANTAMENAFLRFAQYID